MLVLETREAPSHLRVLTLANSSILLILLPGLYLTCFFIFSLYLALSTHLSSETLEFLTSPLIMKILLFLEVLAGAEMEGLS